MNKKRPGIIKSSPSKRFNYTFSFPKIGSCDIILVLLPKRRIPKAEVSEETLCEYRRFVVERFRTEPEALSVTRICELTSMVGMTVHRLIASGILYGTKVQGKTFCSKSTLIDYLASEDTFRNPTCEGCKELVRTFKRRKSDDTYNEQRRERRKLEREKKGSGT